MVSLFPGLSCGVAGNTQVLDLHGDGHRDSSCTALEECQCGSKPVTRPQATHEVGVATKGGRTAALVHQR